MSLPLPDFGLTSWVDFTNDSEIAADAQLRVSAVGDSLGLINDFTQGTNANKPLWTRSDNKENLFQYSQQIDNAEWLQISVTVTPNDIIAPDGTTTADRINLTAAASAHYFWTASTNRATVVAGKTYRVSIRAKAGTHGVIQTLFNSTQFGVNAYINFDLVNGVRGTIGAQISNSGIEALVNGWYYCWAESVCTTTGAAAMYFSGVPSISSAGTPSWTPAAGQNFYAWGLQHQETQADPTYLPTTDHPQYAGVNGRRCLVFNGAQRLNSTSTLADIFALGVKLVYMPVVPFLLSAATGQTTFKDSASLCGISFPVSSTGARFFNNDGGQDNADLTGSTISKLTILRARQSGGKIYIAEDVGAGFGAEIEENSGNTSSLAGTLEIGATASGFYGKILGIATANTGAAKPNLENLLREYFFARSQLRWDPYLADLVLKRQ